MGRPATMMLLSLLLLTARFPGGLDESDAPDGGQVLAVEGQSGVRMRRSPSKKYYEARIRRYLARIPLDENRAQVEAYVKTVKALSTKDGVVQTLSLWAINLGMIPFEQATLDSLKAWLKAGRRRHERLQVKSGGQSFTSPIHGSVSDNSNRLRKAHLRGFLRPRLGEAWARKLMPTLSSEAARPRVGAAALLVTQGKLVRLLGELEDVMERAFLMFGAETGAEVEEIRNVRLRDFEWGADGHLYAWVGRGNGKGRTLTRRRLRIVAACGSLAEAGILRNVPTSSSAVAFTKSVRGDPDRRVPYGPMDVQNMVARWKWLANIQGKFSLRWLRKARIVDLIRQGMSLADVCSFAGLKHVKLMKEHERLSRSRPEQSAAIIAGLQQAPAYVPLLADRLCESCKAIVAIDSRFCTVCGAGLVTKRVQRLPRPSHRRKSP